VRRTSWRHPLRNLFSESSGDDRGVERVSDLHRSLIHGHTVVVHDGGRGEHPLVTVPDDLHGDDRADLHEVPDLLVGVVAGELDDPDVLPRHPTLLLAVPRSH